MSPIKQSRPSVAIPYTVDDGPEISLALLSDGDNLLRLVLGIEDLTEDAVVEAAALRAERIRAAKEAAQAEDKRLSNFFSVICYFVIFLLVVE